MDILALFETDPALESDGVWQKLGDAEFLIARLGNPKYTALIKKLFDENAKVLDVPGEAADALSNKLMTDVWAETILLDWKGVKFRGVDTPYSREAARKAMSLYDFRVKILALSNDLNQFLLKQEEELEKN